MSTYTKGPWSIRQNSFSRREILGGGDVGVLARIADPDDPATPPKSWGECEANARLIAAAPELLEALRNSRTFVAYAYDQGIMGAYEAGIAIDAAIAKAEGREQ